MGRGRSKLKKRSEAGTGRNTRLPTHRGRVATATGDSGGFFPRQSSAVHFSFSAATSPHLGAEKILRNMTVVSEAVVLMAGMGARLGASAPKPLAQLLGRPLIWYTFDALVRAGIKRVYAI